jgi:hypothetical protein
MENQQDIDKKFADIMQPKVIVPKREPAKFPELRYLWGVALIVSFVLIVVSSIIQTLIGA